MARTEHGASHGIERGHKAMPLNPSEGVCSKGAVAGFGYLFHRVSEGMTHVKKVPDAPNIAVEATISAEVSLEEQV